MGDTFNRLLGATATLAGKKPCRAASTSNLTLSGFGTVDGVTFVSSDDSAGTNMRVLVWNQTSASQNGVYLAQSGTWARERDFDGNTDFVKGTPVFVSDGTAYGRNWFNVTSTDPPSVGVNAISFNPMTLTVNFTLNSSSTSTTVPVPNVTLPLYLDGGPFAQSSDAANMIPLLWATDGTTGQIVFNHANNPSTSKVYRARLHT